MSVLSGTKIKEYMGLIPSDKKYTLNPVTIRPMELKPNDHLGFKVIAVIWSNGTWSAYRGLTDWDDEYVAECGDNIGRVTAEALFYAPKAAGLKYME